MKKITIYCLIFFISVRDVFNYVIPSLYFLSHIKAKISLSLCYLFVPERSGSEGIARVCKGKYSHDIA